MQYKAYAKINLVLDVISKREDSYHELAGIMHSIDLFDIVGIMPNTSGEINVRCSEPLPQLNTAYRAARAYIDAAGRSIGKNTGVDIVIEKHIPSEAGLGGASADAAAVLRGMRELFPVLGETDLYAIGKDIGADVPFCLYGGCAKVCGIGERLQRLPVQKLYITLVKGDKGISTGVLFGKYDEMMSQAAVRDSMFHNAVDACKNMNVKKLCDNMFNSLEPVAFTMLPELVETKQRIMRTGARKALMTGSGAVMYGIYDNLESAKRARDMLKEYYGFAETVTTEIG